MTETPMVKVLLRSPDGDVETVWATPVGGSHFRLENSPFFAYGVSWLDVVEAEPDESGFLAMTGVVEKTGHRTVRVILEEELQVTIEDVPIWPRLQELGCTYEGFNRRYIAVDLPPGTDLQQVVDMLVESGLTWEHADPTYDRFHESSG
jgi:hypothetical protein